MKIKIKIAIWWLFWILFLESIYKIFILDNFLTINTLYVYLFSMPIIIILSLLTSAFSEKVNRIITIVLVSFFTFMHLAQIVYYNFYNSMFSFFSLTNGAGQVMQFWQMILEVVIRIWYVFALILIPFILFIIFNKKLFSYKKSKLFNVVVSIILFIIMSCAIVFVIYKDNKGEDSLNNLICSTHAPMLTVNKTGLMSMELIDLYRYIFGFEEKVIEEDTTPVVNNEKSEEEYNIYDIDFESLINSNSDSKVLNMHKYFSSLEPTAKNKYTGLFKGKNLIFITAEGFDTIALDKDITPTLYKLANNGFVFNNYYQPLFPVSTSDGEYMNLTGLIPKEGVWSFYKSSKIKMPFGFGTMFKNQGYTSYGFHNHTYSYYDRDDSHPNIGLTYIGCGNGLEKKMNCKHWPNSDKEMMDATIGYYLNDEKPFATYYMTVSGHLNYNFGGNNMASRNKKAVSKLSYSTAIKAYLATQIELDKAMSTLIDYLTKADKLDDTLIVMAADHYPYGLTTKQMNEISKTDRTNKFENYHSTLIMYNPSLEKTIVDKVVSSIDLLPTVYNLFGIEYDSRLFMGKDIFSDTEGLSIFSDRSWVSDKGKYNSVNKKFYKTTDEEVSNEYISNINNMVHKKFSMSSLILDTNYYKKLGY